jgi:hypothetical protein
VLKLRGAQLHLLVTSIWDNLATHTDMRIQYPANFS